MPQGDLQRDLAAVAVSEEVGLGDVQVLEQRDGVIGGLREGEGTVDVRGAAVSLLVEGDHLSRPREQREQLAERGLDVRAAAVQQHERYAVLRRLSLDLVVELKPVHRRVATLEGAGGQRAEGDG